MRAWLNHAALNAGQGLRALIDFAQCLWFGALPPRWTGHSAEDIEALNRGRLGKWFAFGFGSAPRIIRGGRGWLLTDSPILLDAYDDVDKAKRPSVALVASVEDLHFVCTPRFLVPSTPVRFLFENPELEAKAIELLLQLRCQPRRMIVRR